MTLPQKIGATLMGGLLVVVIAFGVGVLAATAVTVESFPQEFYIGGVEVSGKKMSDASRAVNQRAQDLEKGVTVSVLGYEKYTIPVPRTMINVDATMQSAKRSAQRGALTKRIKDFFGFTQRTDVSFVLEEDAEQLVTEELLTSWGVPLALATDARFEIQNGEVRVISGINGQTIDRERLAEDFEDALSRGVVRITADIIEAEPEITTGEAEELKPQAVALAHEITKGRSLVIKNKKYQLTSEQIVQLLQPRVVDDAVVVSIDPEQLKHMMGEQLGVYEQTAKNPEFERTGNRVTKFVAPVKGVAIDWDVLSIDIYNSLSTTTTEVVVSTKETEPEISLASLNDLGITELIGTGTSDFSGSPSGRVHNIKTGMNALNGILVAPGEEFSTMKYLSPVDGTAGYVQELVIKGNKTIPEYGGGLCQIGTTVFRAAMGAGFNITERRNHSYQVGYYYENGVSGTDATLYEPSPDFKFKNDTAHWVMLETVMLPKSVLEFRFWGTSDGRQASRTIPKTLSTTPPPPRKLIETTDLPPGKMKCTEKPHAGANMVFTYTVRYTDGTVKNQDFPSYYRPWGEVCLIGVTPTSTTPIDEAPAIPLVGPITTDTAGTSGE